MRGWTMGFIAVASLALAAGGTMLVARAQQARPGEIGQNRVLVENHSADQAIPVVVSGTEPLRVVLQGTSTVRVDRTTPVSTRAVRQEWEYRTITGTGAADPARIIAEAGLEGWEAVGYQAGPGGTSVLLKRPR